jgi:hypothetical protein
MRKILVTEEHGRVYRQLDGWRRVLVAIPGEEIDIELARECGLLDEPEVSEPEPKVEEKQSPVKRDHGKQAPTFQSYPTKTHKA